MGHVRAQLKPNQQFASVDTQSPPRRPRLNDRPMLVLGIVAADLLAIAAAAAAVSVPDALTGTGNAPRYAAAVALFAAVLLIAMQRTGLFALPAVVRWRDAIKKVVGAVTVAGALLAALAIGLDVARLYPTPWFAALLAATTLTLALSRTAGAAAIRSLLDNGTLTRAVAIVGATRQANLLVKRLQESNSPGTRIVGVFDERRTRIPGEVQGVPIRGDIHALHVLVRRGMIDDVVVALPWNAEGRVLELIERMRPLPVSVSLAYDTVAYEVQADAAAKRREMPAVNIHPAPLDGWRGIAKDVEDKVLALAALIALAPLMLLIAALIRLDSRGPVIFRQKRFGFNNEVIEIFKFRTMYDDAETRAAFRQARRDDPRVTRVGRLLRRTSLDELPQLVNVLQGRMSLVGPRPHVGEIHDLYTRVISDYDARHKIKPGITGWAQINGCRGETDTVEKMRTRVAFDLWYVEHWSLALDVKILLTTLIHGWTHKNAY